MAVKFIISMIFAILVALFAIQNSGNVEVNFLFAKFSISQALVILISAIVGALIVLILSTVSQIKQNIKIKNSTKAVAKLEEENRLLNQKVQELAGTTHDEGEIESADKVPEVQNNQEHLTDTP